jgi:MinD-like ATPase involved in chromosome partitioning or flagellar assembly
VPNAIGNSSPKGGIGKTTIQLESGVQLTLRGKRVVFIDWDIMSPRLSLRLLKELESGPSLVKVLIGMMDITEAVRETITSGKRGSITVYVVPAVTNDDIPDNINRLLDEMNEPSKVIKVVDKMKSSVERLSKEYDVVFNDYPVPSWATYYTYQHLLSTTSSWINLLSDSNPNMVNLIAELHRRYTKNIPVLGTIINMVRPTPEELNKAKEYALSLCKEVNGKVAMTIPFDGKLYDVFAGGLASPASLNYPPESSPALLLIKKFVDVLERVVEGKAPPGECEALTVTF